MVDRLDTPGEKLEELYQRLYVATTVNTADKDAEKRMNEFLDGIYPRPWQPSRN